MPFTVKLLGPFGLFKPDGERIELSGRKARALMCLLALAPDGVRTRNWLWSMLWGTRGTAQAQASLRRELANLSALLDGASAGHLLVRDGERIQLRLDLLVVDALVRGTGVRMPITLAGGELLEGLTLLDSPQFSQWLAEQRARLSVIEAVDQSVVQPAAFGAMELLGTDLPPAVELISEAPLSVPPKPSIVVLPLADSTHAAGHSLLGTGLAEEIGQTLCGYPQLFVVATGAAAAMIERGMSLQEIGQRLGVRYMLDGRVTRSGQALRITVRLLRTDNAGQLWTYSANGTIDDLFALQAQTAAAVAPQILSTIDTVERDRGSAGPVRSTDSYMLFWRANAVFREWTPASVGEAIALCDELLSREPNSVWGASLAAFCHAVAFRFQLTADPQANLRHFFTHRQTALLHGGDNIHVLGYVAGGLVMIGGDMAVADRLISRALAINNASQPTLFWGGWVDIANGNPQRGRERFELSLRINPASGVRAYAITGIGIALLFEGRHAEAYTMLSDAVLYVAHYPMTLAGYCVAAAMVGERDSAWRAARTLRDSGLDEQVISTLQNPAHQAMLRMGLTLALQGGDDQAA